jgi:uncharacterized Zn finger protein
MHVFGLPMIDLGSICGLHEHDHELHACCASCERRRALDLARLIREGKGDLRLPLTVSCRICGERGQLQVRPPAPTRSPSIVRRAPESMKLSEVRRPTR